MVVSVGVNVFFGGEGGFGDFFLDFLEDFFFLDLFLSLTYDVDEEDSELEEYQLCLEVEDELLDSSESDDDGSEGSMGDCNNCVEVKLGTPESCIGRSDDR